MSPYPSLYDDSLQKFCASVREDRIKEGDEDGEAQLQHFLSSKATMQQVRDSAADLQQETSRKYSSKKGKIYVPAYSTLRNQKKTEVDTQNPTSRMAGPRTG